MKHKLPSESGNAFILFRQFLGFLKLLVDLNNRFPVTHKGYSF